MIRSFLLFLILLTISSENHAQKGLYKTCIAAFYNLENFYDTIDSYNVMDEEFTPKGAKHYNSDIYFNKVEHLATVISQIGANVNSDGPALLGVAEIENENVLKELVHHSLLITKNYKIVHYDSKDIRGVDVAFLYNPKYFTVEASEKIFVQLPTGTKEAYFTRDILYVKGKLDGETVHIFVNHWPSRRGGEDRSAPAREMAAFICKQQIEIIQHHDANAKIILMGDLNDDPNSPSIKNVLKVNYDAIKIQPKEIHNPWYTNYYKKGIGTLAFNDAWGLFDQILITQPFISKQQEGFFFYGAYIFKKDFMIEPLGRYKGYPKRTWDGNTYNAGYSDHFPTYLVLLKKTE
jgi:hypothetical protein